MIDTKEYRKATGHSPRGVKFWHFRLDGKHIIAHGGDYRSASREVEAIAHKRGAQNVEVMPTLLLRR